MKVVKSKADVHFLVKWLIFISYIEIFEAVRSSVI